MNSQFDSPSSSRATCLCYFRDRVRLDTVTAQSWRKRMEVFCLERDWNPEWHEDDRTAVPNNRPGWDALQARLVDPDIVTLVIPGYDFVSRRPAVIQQLHNQLIQLDLTLAVVTPAQTSILTPEVLKQMTSFKQALVEFYLQEITERVHAALVRRRSQSS